MKFKIIRKKCMSFGNVYNWSLIYNIFFQIDKAKLIQEIYDDIKFHRDFAVSNSVTIKLFTND